MIFNQQCPCAGRYYEPLSTDSGFFMPVFRRCVKGNEMKVTLDDHSAEVLSALDAAIARGLETCGLVAEGYAKKLCPVDTGNLRNSITHTVDSGEKAAYTPSAGSIRHQRGSRPKRQCRRQVRYLHGYARRAAAILCGPLQRWISARLWTYWTSL